MRFRGSLWPTVVALIDVATSNAFTAPLRRVPKVQGRKHNKRLDMSGSFENGSTILGNSNDAEYLCNITLNGKEFEVIIDTGSSDLWVVGDIPNATSVGVSASVSYAVGSVLGNIQTATLDFGGFTINEQAYIQVDPAYYENPIGTGDGIIGLGPNSASQVFQLLDAAESNTTGLSVLNHLFLQNISTPNILTVFLSRDGGDSSSTADVSDSSFTGQLTIGEVLPDLEAINDQPKLPALTDYQSSHWWMSLLDADGIIGPDGNPIPTKSGVIPSSDDTNSGPTYNQSQLHVVFDTGYTIPQVPKYVADAIYGHIPMAQYINSSSPGFWAIPCDYELNVTFIFGGVKFPIAPLDLSLAAEVDEDGSELSCYAGFQEILPQVAASGVDAIMGMGFLRNAYLLLDYGDFVKGGNATADPYLQLLSTVNPAAVHNDFVKTRLNGVDTTGSQQPLLPSIPDPSEQGETAPSELLTSDRSASTGRRPRRRTRSITRTLIGVVVAIVLSILLLGIAVFYYCRRRKRVPYQPVYNPPVTSAYRGTQPVSYGHQTGGQGYSTPSYQFGR